MEHEGGIDMAWDKFYKKGIKIMQKENEAKEWEVADSDNEMITEDDDIELLCGRIMQEELKEVLFTHLEEDGIHWIIID